MQQVHQLGFAGVYRDLSSVLPILVIGIGIRTILCLYFIRIMFYALLITKPYTDDRRINPKLETPTLKNVRSYLGRKKE